MKKKMSDGYASFAYKLCGGWVEMYLLEYFQDMRPDIQRAGMKLTVIEYLSIALATTILVFVAEVPLSAVIVTVLSKSAVLGVITGLMIGVVTSAGIFTLFYVYPSVLIEEHRKRINDSLPFAILYLTTVAGSGTPPVAMFRMLSKFKEYEEIAAEANNIMYDIDIAGLSLPKALENAANRTPSDDLKEILWGINNTLTTGGDLKALLYEKAGSAMSEYRRNLNEFTSKLSMITEIYLTAVIVGSIFFMVLSSIMSSFGGSPGMIIGIQMVVTFIYLPFMSLVFLFVIKRIQPAHVI